MADYMQGMFGSRSGSGAFPNPWQDIASSMMPTGIREMLRWGEFIFQNNSTYRMAMERIIAYFLTAVEIGAVDTISRLGDDEKEKYRSFCEDRIHILDDIQSLDRDCIAYGNGFTSFVVPFQRFLVCPKCYNQYLLREVDGHSQFKFKWDRFKFIATCPNCKTGSGYRGEWIVNDQPVNLEQSLSLKHWSPHEIEILTDPYTGERAYLWKIPQDYKQQVTNGDMFILERTPLPVIDAISKNQLFMFGPNVLFHMMEPTLSGIPNRGWGLPRSLINFRDVFHCQVLRRMNEAIAMDFIVPLRIITPEVRNGNPMSQGALTDPLIGMSGSDFTYQMLDALRRRRQDPASWHVVSHPIRYHLVGGEAANLAPRDQIEQANNTLLNGSGAPVEFHQGTMRLDAMPISLRLLEATWSHLPASNNRFLYWFVEQVSQLLSWERVSARMRRVTYADDVQKQMMILQLSMGGVISQTTALRALGIEYKDEVRGIAEESRFQQETQARVQEEMDQSAFGEQIAKGQMPAPAGGMPPGGVPAGPGGAPAGPGGAAGMPGGPVSAMLSSANVPMSPQDIMAQAESLANQLLALPESQKDSELRQLKQKNNMLHAVVQEKMEEIRSRAQTAGGAMLLGQQPAQQ